MKFRNGLTVSASLAGIPVRENRIHLYVAAGDGTLSGGALITQEEARALHGELGRAIEAAQAAAMADSAMRGSSVPGSAP